MYFQVFSWTFSPSGVLAAPPVLYGLWIYQGCTLSVSRSLIKMLKSIGPSIEPRDTPVVAYLKIAFVLLLCTAMNFKLSFKLNHLNLDK